jgi:hypothetical protein
MSGMLRLAKPLRSTGAGRNISATISLMRRGYEDGCDYQEVLERDGGKCFSDLVFRIRSD